MKNLKTLFIALAATTALVGCGGGGAASLLTPQATPYDILFTFRTGQGQPWHLHKVDAAGGTPMPMFGNDVTVSHTVASRDGSKIFFRSNLGFCSAIAAAPVPQVIGSLSLSFLALNGTSDLLAIQRSNGRIYTMNTDLTNEVELTTTGKSRYPSFHPTLPKIIYSEGDFAEADIWTMNADGSGKQPLLVAPGQGETNPTYSWDGTKIYFLRGNDVMVMNADGTAEKKVAHSALLDPIVALPDGRILFARALADQPIELASVKDDGTDIRVHYTCQGGEQVVSRGALLKPQN